MSRILFGATYLLTIYGVPTIVDSVSFLVPDSLIETSFTLSEVDFLPCPRHRDCSHSSSAQCQRPYSHLHIDDELVVSLYRKSDTLWEFLDFEAAFHDAGSDIICADDVRLPPATLGRALILLLCRNHGSACETYWMAILTYMLEFVDGTVILNEEEGLRGGFKQFHHAQKLGDPTMYLILEGSAVI
ncbi:hypothetical protein BDW72DRAFT_206192 [Aspergillus terricola var. indicus]